jgi:type I restriction enzyme, S subunit
VTFAKIHEIAEVNPRAKGISLKTHDLVTFVPMAAVSEQSRSVISPEVRPYGEVCKGYTYFEEGDVIIAKITPCFENGKIALAAGLPHPIAFGSTEYHVIRSGNNVHNRYLFYLLQSPYVLAAGASRMKGAAGQKRVPAEFFKDLTVPLPPLEEQKRIAAILEAADELRTKRRESLAQLDTLLQSTFLDLFGDPVTNPKEWEEKLLSEVVRPGTIVTYGIVQAGDEFSGGIPYIRTGDIVDGEIVEDGLRHTNPVIASKFERSRVDTGDIVMSIRATVGTTAVVPPSLDGANLTQGTARIAPGPDALLPFLLHYLRSHGAQRWIQRQVKGATFKEITLGRLRELPVLLPPIGIQKKFGEIVAQIEERRLLERNQLDELDHLFASLQSRAFRGEL